jgi:hypothetical protein
MTAQLLASELGNLIQDAKRKNSELRNAAEKSLQDLKALPVTSEAQLAAGELFSDVIFKKLTKKETFQDGHTLSLHFWLRAALTMPNSAQRECLVFKDLVSPERCQEKDWLKYWMR